MLYAMKARVPQSPGDFGNLKAWRALPSPFVIDIGANVGWFTLNAALAGGTVAAFEGAQGTCSLPARWRVYGIAWVVLG